MTPCMHSHAHCHTAVISKHNQQQTSRQRQPCSGSVHQTNQIKARIQVHVLFQDEQYLCIQHVSDIESFKGQMSNQCKQMREILQGTQTYRRLAHEAEAHINPTHWGAGWDQSLHGKDPSRPIQPLCASDIRLNEQQHQSIE